MRQLYRYDIKKNAKLIIQRGIGFDEIIAAIDSDDLIETRPHHNQYKYPNQQIMYVECSDEVYMVPYVIEKDGTLFLKTLFPSKKARKEFTKRNKDE